MQERDRGNADRAGEVVLLSRGLCLAKSEELAWTCIEPCDHGMAILYDAQMARLFSLYQKRTAMKPKTVPLFAMVLQISAQAQSPMSILWDRTYGGADADAGSAMCATADGGLVIVGWSESVSAQVQADNGQRDLWILRVDADGEFLWHRTYGGSGNETSQAVGVAEDGDIYVVANTQSNDGDFGSALGTDDLVFLRLSDDGELLAQTRWGGPQGATATDLLVLPNGDCIVVGGKLMLPSNNPPHIDAFLIRANEMGEVILEETYGGTGYDVALAITAGPSGDLVMVGETRSNDGDVALNMGLGDGWMLSVSPDGQLIDERTFGGEYNDQLSDVTMTSDGGMIVTGYYSYPMLIGGSMQASTLVVAEKLNASGETEWIKDYGGTNGDYGWLIREHPSGGYLLYAYAYSNDGDAPPSVVQVDTWLLRLDAEGELLWHRPFGGTWSFDSVSGMLITENGGAFLLAVVETGNSDMTTYLGGLDTWLIRLGPEVVGVEEHGSSLASMTPDPDGSGFTVQLYDAARTVSIEVLDASGRLFRSIPSTSNSIHVDLKASPAGVYIVSAFTGSQRSVFRFMRR